ncbi:Hpt domain-containing protein, partial [Vibrio sp. M260118]|uniref:Hpt domain-containing protein n=1 Tax=Vibrio sp. M260118 TaxID=3020896 RepID=UPI002F414E21
FDSPYSVHMADSQSLNLQLIYALRLQLDAHYDNSWLLPDINRLLFTTDRFIEQSQIYLNNNLELLSLVDQMGTMRELYSGQLTEPLYFQLSSNILEAIFGDSTSSPQVYRDLDNIYSQSNQLVAKERKDLQQVLAQVSSVLGDYAQGRYIVEKLQTHDVHNQISVLRGEFDDLLARHIWLGLALTLVVFCGYMVLLRSSVQLQSAKMKTQTDSHQQDQASHSAPSHQKEISTELETGTPTPFENQASTDLTAELNTQQAVELEEQEIDFEKMIESLNNDTESVCMLLEVFIEDHLEDGEKIEQLLTSEPETAQRKAHSLKGVGGNLGATKLREAASKVEASLKDFNRIEPNELDELKQRLERAIKEARIFLNEHKNTNN